MSTLGPPIPPAPLALYNVSATITTPEFGTVDAQGAPVRGVGSTDSNVMGRLDTMSPSESYRMGHHVDETVYRFICPVAKADGSAITVKKDFYVTINSVKYKVIGAGKREGASGEQTLILKQEDQ